MSERTIAGVRTALLSLLVGAAPLSAQEYRSARDATREIQRLRDAAEPLWKQGDPEGLVLLERAWEFLDREAVADLVRGSARLQTRLPSLALEMACAHAIVADTAGALNDLEQIRDVGGNHTVMVRAIERSCPALHALAALPR